MRGDVMPVTRSTVMRRCLSLDYCPRPVGQSGSQGPVTFLTSTALAPLWGGEGVPQSGTGEGYYPPRGNRSPAPHPVYPLRAAAAPTPEPRLLWDYSPLLFGERVSRLVGTG